MSTSPSNPKDRAKIEALCLLRALIPMPEDNGRRVAKWVALILVCVWSIQTLALTLESIDAVSPPFYTAFTALVYMLIGRLWDLEVKSLLPSGGGKDDS